MRGMYWKPAVEQHQYLQALVPSSGVQVRGVLEEPCCTAKRRWLGVGAPSCVLLHSFLRCGKAVKC